MTMRTTLAALALVAAAVVFMTGGDAIAQVASDCCAAFADCCEAALDCCP